MRHELQVALAAPAQQRCTLRRPVTESGDNVHELRPDEEWARQMIEHDLGVPVVQHDDGSTESAHDLTIQYPSRP